MRRLSDRSAGFVGVVAAVLQFALGFFYVGLVVLVVPRPEFFAFWAAWVAGLVLVIVLALRRSWTSILVPAVWLAAFVVALTIGENYLGWGP
jgi:hypothetical protein